MSEYKDTIITNQGLILADKASHGLASFQIKRATGSEADLSSLSDSQVQDLSNIEEDDKTGVLVDSGDEADETLAETVVSFDNQDLAKGYFLRTIGLWATDNNGKEILYSVTRAITPEYIPDFNKKNLLQFKINVQIIVGNRANVTIQLSRDGLATIGYTDKSVDNAKSYLIDNLKDYYVDKNSNQDVTGMKNFSNGLKVNSNDLYVQNGTLMYNGNQLVTSDRPIIYDFSINNMYPSGINWHIDIDENGNKINNFTICYKSSTSSTWSYIVNAQLNGNIPANVGDSYDVKVIAQNGVGTSESVIKTINYAYNNDFDNAIQIEHIQVGTSFNKGMIQIKNNSFSLLPSYVTQFRVKFYTYLSRDTSIAPPLSIENIKSYDNGGKGYTWATYTSVYSREQLLSYTQFNTGGSWSGMGHITLVEGLSSSGSTVGLYTFLRK